MASITLEQAAAWCGGLVAEEYKKIAFDGASNDSRTVCRGQLFVALIGQRDGNDFIPMAMEKGAAAVLTSRKGVDCPAIVVEDVRLALGKIAAGLRKKMKLQVVGVTGSVGKSTTKEMIAAVLEGDHIVGKTPANFNNDLGLPMTILGMAQDTQVAVLEMGMSHFGEISYLSAIAKPDVAVITNIGTMHMENLGSRQGILQAKMEICDGMDEQGILLLNGNDDLLWRQHGNIVPRVACFGREKPDCHLWAEKIEQTEEGLSFTVVTPTGEFPVTLPLEGEHYLLDAMAAIAVGLTMNVAPEHIAGRLARFQNMAGRQEIFEAAGCTIIKDCYNAGPESMAAALKVLAGRRGRKIAVLGDMLELGEISRAAHEQVGATAAQCADHLLTYGPNAPVTVAAALNAGMTHACPYERQEDLAQALKALCEPGDVLLFKGSHGMHMERILELFLRK